MEANTPQHLMMVLGWVDFYAPNTKQMFVEVLGLSRMSDNETNVGEGTEPAATLEEMVFFTVESKSVPVSLRTLLSTATKHIEQAPKGLNWEIGLANWVAGEYQNKYSVRLSDAQVEHHLLPQVNQFLQDMGMSTPSKSSQVTPSPGIGAAAATQGTAVTTTATTAAQATIMIGGVYEKNGAYFQVGVVYMATDQFSLLDFLSEMTTQGQQRNPKVPALAPGEQLVACYTGDFGLIQYNASTWAQHLSKRLQDGEAKWAVKILTQKSSASVDGNHSTSSNVASEVLVTPHTQGCASDFTGKKDHPMAAVGCFFTETSLLRPRGDPITAFENVFGSEKKPIPDEEVLVVDAKLRELTMDPATMRCVHETTTQPNVQENHLDKLFKHLGGPKRGFFTTTRQQGTRQQKCDLAQLGCNDGVAKGTSEPDGFVLGPLSGPKGFVRVVKAIVEATSSRDCPGEAIRQAFGESTGVALQHARRGVDLEKVAVPVWVVTGKLMKLGVTRMLQPAFPYFDVLTKVLDLTNRDDRNMAAKLLLMTRAFCESPTAATPAQSSTSLQLGLSTSEFYLKKMEDVFKVYENDIDASLRHFGDQVQKLITSEARAVVEVPITMRTGLSTADSSLVFHNLKTRGYTIGVPQDSAIRELYLAAIKMAMNLVHSAGVVHLDFYPSNFMWKVVEGFDEGNGAETGRVDVKIIDWDSAHPLDGKLTSDTRDRLELLRERKVLAKVSSVDRAVKDWDTSLFEVLTECAEDQRLHTDEKPKLDQAFRECVAEKAAKQELAAAAAAAAAADDDDDDDDDDDEDESGVQGESF